MNYTETMATAPMVYNICSTFQRMMDHFGLRRHPVLDCAAWILKPEWADALDLVYRQYFAVGEKYNVPMIACVTNRRGYRENVAAVPAYRNHDLMKENMEFARNIAKDFKNPIFIGALEGCIGDQYIPGEKMEIRQAYELHLRHMDEWLENTPDFIYTGIMPEISETVGMAKACSDSGIPYHVGFIVTDDGRLLDGTSIHDAISMVDDATERPADLFMCNCIHPTNLLHALEQPFNQTEVVRTRLQGTIANASMLKPRELETAAHIDNDSARELVDALVTLCDYHPMRVVGGCCGTNDIHMEEIVRRMEQWRKARA